MKKTPLFRVAIDSGPGGIQREVSQQNRERDTSTSSGLSRSPFNHPGIRDWCFERAERIDELVDPAPFGSGPFEEEDFATFLSQHNIESLAISDETDLLVVGREAWSRDTLDWLLKMRSGETLRVYSQEMYLTYWLTGNDPLKAPLQVIEAFRQGHPALEYISEGWPDWPSTRVPEESSGDLSNEEWWDCGLLTKMGYRAGSKAPPRSERRAILRRILEDPKLPEFNSPVYIAKWGKARSAVRLRKLANSIATFCRNGKRRRTNPPKKAIAHWEEDLAWLNKEFYSGRFAFEWPGT